MPTQGIFGVPPEVEVATLAGPQLGQKEEHPGK